MWVESTAIKNAIARVPSTFRVYAKLLASWPYRCSLAGQTLSRLGVCPAKLVPVRVAIWVSGQLSVRTTARN